MRWMWIDQIIELESGKRIVAIRNVALAEDYLDNHFGRGRNAQSIMPAAFLIEGMAMTAGTLVGEVHRFSEKVILAKISTAQFDIDVVPGQVIRYEATLDRMDRAGASTRGIVSRFDFRTHAWAKVGVIDLMFSHIDQNISGREFPAENFVFGESYRTLLRNSGLDHLYPNSTTPAPAATRS